jgi:hypothetical protein
VRAGGSYRRLDDLIFTEMSHLMNDSYGTTRILKDVRSRCLLGKWEVSERWKSIYVE